MLGALDDRLHVATDIIDRGKDSDKLAALNFLARYSGLDEIGVVVDTELLNALFTVIEFYVKDDDALADIRENGWMFSRTASECDACTLSAMYDAVA